MAELALAAYAARERDRIVADLFDWLRIPSISADPELGREVRRSAEWVAERLKEAGLENVTLLETAGGDGWPSVYGDWLHAGPNAPTVLVYGHHDVQPVDPIELWHTDPFDPTIDGDILRARGSSDDKGQLLFHLLGLRAHLAATGRTSPAVNLKFLIEGEEESGSPNFEALLADKRDRLDCDVVVITDTGVLGPDIPSTVTGMRGLVVCHVAFHGPDMDLHSGVFGGAVPNPATVAAQVAGQLHDADGRVTVPGFYDDVVELTDEERALFAKVPHDEGEFLEVTHSRALYGEKGQSTLERIGARPTAEVNGLGGGYQGDGGKTIIPSDAFCKLSFRLVANQDPNKIRAGVEQYIAARVPNGIEWSIEWEGDGVSPCLVPTGTPAYEALTAALSEAFDGREVLPTREGGSGPEAAIQDALGAPLVFLGVGLPDDQIHAPNEKVNLSMLYRGAHAAALLWSKFADVGKAGLRG